MKNKLPTGWNEDKMKRVINHYKTQSEDEAVTEDEAAFALEETLVQVPDELVANVQALIAKHEHN